MATVSTALMPRQRPAALQLQAPPMATPTQPFVWGANGEQVSAAELERQRKVSDALRAKTAPTGPWSLLGDLADEGVATYRDSKSADAEKAAQKLVAEALAKGDYQSVIANDMATPQQSAVASALWQQQQQNDDPLRKLQIEQAQLNLEQDKNPAVEPPKAPTVQDQYDPVTGRSRKMQWDPGSATWQPFGGVEAPKDPLVTVNNGDNSADADFYKAGNTARGKMFSDIETAGLDAQTKIGQVNQLENLLSKAPTGAEGAWKQMAGEFGITTDGLSDIQASQALINTMVPAQRPPGSGTMSDADLALFKASLPRIINTPEGNALIVQTLKGVAVYQQKLGDIATQVLNKELTPAEGRAAMAAVPNPLELFRKGGGSASDAASPPDGVDAAIWSAMTPEERALWN